MSLMEQTTVRDARENVEWATRAAPGQSVTYHIGSLAIDRAGYHALYLLAETVLIFSECGYVATSQAIMRLPLQSATWYSTSRTGSRQTPHSILFDRCDAFAYRALRALKDRIANKSTANAIRDHMGCSIATASRDLAQLAGRKRVELAEPKGIRPSAVRRWPSDSVVIVGSVMPEPKSNFMAVIGQQPGASGRALKYEERFCDIIKLLAQSGRFPEAWACELGVSVETLRRWGHEHSDFRDSLIAAKHLLGDYWTQEIARNRNNPDAKPGMYQMLARRLPALFGKEPVDLSEYVLRPAAPEDTEAAPEALTANQAKTLPTEELTARLEALRRRRREEQG